MDQAVATSRGARACVIAVPGFEALAEGIALYLQDRGLTSRVGWPDTEDDAVVVLLSRDVPAGLDAIAERAVRLVPVRVGDIAEAQIPEALRALNWVPWTPMSVDLALDAIYRACLTDLDTFFEEQSLEARAAGWSNAGRSNADLVRTRKELRQLTLVAERSAQLSPQAQEFVLQSRTATRAATLTAWLRRFVVAGLSLVLAVGVLRVIAIIEQYGERQNLYILASFSSHSLPVAQIPKLAALVYLSAEIGETAPFDGDAQLARMLSQPAPVQAFLGAPNSMVINGTAIGRDGSLLQVSGDGSLWRGAVGQAGLSAAGSVPHPGYFLAADAELEAWAVADRGHITVASSDGQVTLDAGLSNVDALRMQRDGAALVALDEGETEAEVYVVDGGLHRERSLGGVLAMGEVNGRLVLVQAEGGRARVVDALSGSVLSDVSIPAEVDAVTVLADGSVVFVSDQRLWWQTGTTPTSVGLAVTTTVTDLQTTTGTEVLLATVGDGTRLVDVATGTPIASVCQEGFPLSIDISVDAHWATCGYGGSGWIWDLEAARPTGAGLGGSGAVEARQGVIAARLSGGRLEIESDGQTVVYDPATIGSGTDQTDLEPDAFVEGVLTTVALLPEGTSIAYGTDLGEVVVADISPSLDLLVTQTWLDPQRLPVTSLTLNSGQLSVTSESAAWQLRPCTGCRIDLVTLLRTQAERQLPCYLSNFDGVIPPRISEQMGLRVCEGGD